jgi:PIN domain nuclease of toxin-antitoxin system
MSRLLLDTHIVLWWFGAHPRLSAAARAEIAAGECWISACSIWEVAIKFRLGKLSVAPDALLAAARDGNFRLLPVSPEHAVATAKLLPVHADPFDRLLVAQARSEGLTLLTADALLAEYGTQVRCLA